MLFDLIIDKHEALQPNRSNDSMTTLGQPVTTRPQKSQPVTPYCRKALTPIQNELMDNLKRRLAVTGHCIDSDAFENKENSIRKVSPTLDKLRSTPGKSKHQFIISRTNFRTECP